jgi:tetratricopeptide (TPR) repeat protein
MLAEVLMPPPDQPKLESSVLHSLGIAAFQHGKVDVALKFLLRACADPLALAVWHRDYAEMLDRQGQSEAAEAAVRLAIQRDPDLASAWETLGTILAQRGVVEESCACYQRAVRIDPTFVPALNNLAVTLDRMGKLEAAEERFRQVLRLVPDNADIQLNFATLLGELGRHWEALQIARRVCDHYPNTMRARALVAQFRRLRLARRYIACQLRRDHVAIYRRGCRLAVR